MVMKFDQHLWTKKVLPTIPDSDGNFSIQENEIGSKKELEVSASGNEVFGFYWSQSDGPYLFRKP